MLRELTEEELARLHDDCCIKPCAYDGACDDDCEVCKAPYHFRIHEHNGTRTVVLVLGTLEMK